MNTHKTMRALISDLQNPPRGFPIFDMRFDYAEDDGKARGGIAAFVVSRWIGAKNLKAFAAEGRNFRHEAIARTGLPIHVANALMQPRVLIDANYPLETIKSREMAKVVEHYVASGEICVDYRRFLRNWDDDLGYLDNYTDLLNLRTRIDDFMKTQGDD